MMPLSPRDAEELDWYFRGRQGEVVCPSPDPDLDLRTAALKFSAARFEALYRMWLQRGTDALRAMQVPTLRDQLQRSWGRLEFAVLPHQYLQLTPLVGDAVTLQNRLQEGDNLASA